MFNMCVRSFSAKSFAAFVAPISVRRMGDSVLCNDSCRRHIWGSDDLLGLLFFFFSGGNLLAYGRLFSSLSHIACLLIRITIQDIIGVKTGAYGLR